MEIRKIYFDLDDTLADFSLGLSDICGIKPMQQEKSMPEQNDAMWEAIKNAGNFYYRLKECELGVNLFNKLWRKYGDKVEILSAIPKEKRGIVTAEEDKRRWVEEHLNKDVIVNITRSSKFKKNFAFSKDCILIDDLKRNIDEWIEAGGTGIWFLKDDEAFTVKEVSDLGILQQ